MKIAGSGAGSIGQKLGSPDPDPKYHGSPTLCCGLGSVRGPVHAARRLPDDGAARGGSEPG